MSDFELFLDESGSFDDAYGDDPRNSVVGGVLANNDTLTEQKTKEVLKNACGVSGYPWPPDSIIHSNEIPKTLFPSFSITVLETLKELGIRPVIFENSDRIKIVDATITHLNILAEGIIQLFGAITPEKNKIRLSIKAADRMVPDKRFPGASRKIIKEEYAERLRERIELATIRGGTDNNLKSTWNYELTLGSAREDFRLMIADVVCHSRFTRRTKYDRNQHARLEEIFATGYLFNVIEHGSIIAVDRLTAEGAIGEALFECLSSHLHRIDALHENYGSLIQDRQHGHGAFSL